MTITEATHALARARRTVEPEPTETRPIRLTDAMRRVEPSWVEAVAIVQSVCSQLPSDRAMPALEALMLGPDGAITFAETVPGDGASAVRAAGRLLTTILGGGECPLLIWDATERASLAPERIGTAQAFGALLTCVAAGQPRRELARYYDTSFRHASGRGASAAGVRAFELTARAGMWLMAVLIGGAGVGISVGACVTTWAQATPLEATQTALLMALR